MKTRLGFVSNSSSSSFVCSICKETFEGYNGDYGDIHHMGCENGHGFCSDCIESSLTIEVLQDLITNNLDPEELSTDPDKLREHIDDDFGGIMDFLREFSLEWDLPSSICPICRFEKLTDYDGLRYLMYKTNMNREEILKEIKEQLGTYKKFSDCMMSFATQQEKRCKKSE